MTRESLQDHATHQESDDALVLARAIDSVGMSGVASFALSMLKPLHWLGGQALWMLQPFIGGATVGVGGRSLSTGAVARLLEREGGMDELAAHLDRLQTEGKREDGGG